MQYGTQLKIQVDDLMTELEDLRREKYARIGIPYEKRHLVSLKSLQTAGEMLANAATGGNTSPYLDNRQEQRDAVWMTHYLSVEDRLKRLSKSIDKSEMIDQTFRTGMDREMQLARDEMNKIRGK
jgi:hypothetical protein